ncbi:MAG: phosphatase PAP2 family protein [Acidobacteriota bacterium]|nr:phosphatase PAP2 family protein [Acidobacteriota bacterium]
MSAILHVDALVRGWLTLWHPWWLDITMATLSVVSTSGAVWLAIGAVQAARRRLLLPRLWQLTLAILTALLVSDEIVKPLVHRPRPFVAQPGLVRILGNPPTGSGFPSAHVAAAFAAAWVLAQLFPRGRVAFWSLAGAIACSRIYVGAHYPLDVMAGALLGAAVGWLAIGGSDGLTRNPMAAPSQAPNP